MKFKVLLATVLSISILLPGINFAQNKVVVVPLVGAASVTDFEWVSQSTSLDSTTSKGVIVECPEGKVVIGGGARLFGTISTQTITVNGRFCETEWWDSAREIVATSNPWGVRVDVHCARISE